MQNKENHIMQHAPQKCDCGSDNLTIMCNPGIVKQELALSIPYVVECLDCEEQYSTIPF